MKPVSVIRQRINKLRRRMRILALKSDLENHMNHSIVQEMKNTKKQMNQAKFHLLVVQHRPFDAFKKNDGLTTAPVDKSYTMNTMSAPSSPRQTFAVPYGTAIETNEQIARRQQQLANQEEIYGLVARISSLESRIGDAYSNPDAMDMIRRLQRELAQHQNRLQRLQMRMFSS